MNDILWPQTISELHRKYQVKLAFDLRPYDYNPGLFDDTFSKLSNYHFAPNERIVITLIDTQYYPASSIIGSTLYNLHAALSYYRISPNFVLIFTNHYGLQRELNWLANDFKFDKPIEAIVSFYDVIGTTPSVDPIDLNENDVDYTYTCLNGIQRSHRILLLSFLKEAQLLDKGIVTTNFSSLATVDSSKVVKTNTNVIYQTLSNPTRINDTIKMSEESREICSKHYASFAGKNITHPLVKGTRNSPDTRWQPKFLQKSLVYLVTETVGDYPYFFLTEKTFKGLLVKRPMLIAGAKSSLGMLRRLGFQTWDKWWDESYDDLETFEERAKAIVKIIERLTSYSTETQRRICLEMKDVLEYNFQFYQEKFCNEDYRHYLKQI